MITNHLLAVQLQILFWLHRTIFWLIGIGRVDAFRNVSEDLLCPQHTVGIQAVVIRVSIGVIPSSEDLC